MDITSFIPVGQENAISRQELQLRTGQSDRVNRKQIEKARIRGIRIISSSGSKGYYIARDDREWRSFLGEHLRRANSEIDLCTREIARLNQSNSEGKTVDRVREHIRVLGPKDVSGQIKFEEEQNGE